jgi:hypothetical protein
MAKFLILTALFTSLKKFTKACSRFQKALKICKFISLRLNFSFLNREKHTGTIYKSLIYKNHWPIVLYCILQLFTKAIFFRSTEPRSSSTRLLEASQDQSKKAYLTELLLKVAQNSPTESFLLGGIARVMCTAVKEAAQD